MTEPSRKLEFLFFSSGRITYPRNGTSLTLSILKRTLHGTDDRRRHNRCSCQRYRHTVAPPTSDPCEVDVGVLIQNGCDLLVVCGRRR